MARAKSPSAIRDQIRTLQKQLREAEDKEALRIGQVAIKAGVETVDLSENELEAAFAEMVHSFRSGREKEQRPSDVAQNT